MTTETLPAEPVDLPAVRTGGAVQTRALAENAISETIQSLEIVREFIFNALKEGREHDFGTVPGCGKKKVLLQPGAQKICMFLNVHPDYAIQRIPFPDHPGHVEYIVTTKLKSRETDKIVGEGVGSCSSLEKKYRYRKSGRVCPQCKEPVVRPGKGGGYYCDSKSGGCGTNFTRDNKQITSQQVEGQSENPDIADVYNTVLKMAKKRSFVDGTLSLSCISDYFTQDLDDDVRDGSEDRNPGQGQKQQSNQGSRSNQSNQQKTDSKKQAPKTETSNDWRTTGQGKAWLSKRDMLMGESGTIGTDHEKACRDNLYKLWQDGCAEAKLNPQPNLIEAGKFAGLLKRWSDAAKAQFRSNAELAKSQKAKPVSNGEHAHDQQFDQLHYHLLRQLGNKTLSDEERSRKILSDTWEIACNIHGLAQTVPSKVSAELFQKVMETWQGESLKQKKGR